MKFLRRLLWLLVVFGALATAAWLWRAPLLTGLARAWIIEDPLTRADVIIVLGGGPATRPFEAARLYHQSLAPKILVMKSVADATVKFGLATSEAEILRKVLQKQEVPEGNIALADDEVRSTYEESTAVRNWSRTNHVKSMIIVTDVFHARRVRWLFGKRFKDEGVQVLVRAVPVQEYTTNDWWRKEQGVVAFQNEVLKYAYYRVRY